MLPPIAGLEEYPGQPGEIDRHVRIPSPESAKARGPCADAWCDRVGDEVEHVDASTRHRAVDDAADLAIDRGASPLASVMVD